MKRAPVDPSGPPPRERVASARKNEILALARTLFADRGYSSTSMRDLAEASGVLPGSLYAHFRSKADLARQIVMAFFVEVLPVQEAAFAAPGTGADRFALMVDDVYAVCAKHHEAMRILHYDWKVLSAIEELGEMRTATDRTLDLWSAVVRAGIDDGSIDADIDPEYMVRIVTSTLHGMIDQGRYQNRPKPKSRLSGAETLRRCLLVGITRPPAKPRARR
jgi:AcrR family transcriptional regulator